jgi:hypothetical protein
VKTAPPLLLGLLVAATACAQIIGIEHYGIGTGQGGSTGWACAFVDELPGAQCIAFAAGPEGEEADAGLDPAGVASITVCDPVSNLGCVGTDVCVPDAAGANYYCARGGDNPVPACGACDLIAQCGPGLLCFPVEATCLRMCCTDADCGAGHCVTSITPLPDGVGVCVQ